MVVSLVCRDVQGLHYKYPPATGEFNQRIPKPLREVAGEKTDRRYADFEILK